MVCSSSHDVYVLSLMSNNYGIELIKSVSPPVWRYCGYATLSDAQTATGITQVAG